MQKKWLNEWEWTAGKKMGIQKQGQKKCDDRPPQPEFRGKEVLVVHNWEKRHVYVTRLWKKRDGIPCGSWCSARQTGREKTRWCWKSLHLKAARALNVHKEAVGALNETLELVVVSFGGSVGVKQIFFNLMREEKGGSAQLYRWKQSLLKMIDSNIKIAGVE